MTETIRKIIKDIIDDFNLDCKRVTKNNLNVAGCEMNFGTPHMVLYYNMKNIGKCIYMEYDEYRNVARNVMVFDL